MADVHDKATRSKNMAAIKGKNTGLELLVRKFLHSKGFRFNLDGKVGAKHLPSYIRKRGKNKLPGKPDIVLPKYKTVIFVHGCFWHGHENCRDFVLPKTSTEWWLNKINGNIANDQKAVSAMQDLGWKVIELWGCALKPQKVAETLNSLKNLLKPR